MCCTFIFMRKTKRELACMLDYGTTRTCDIFITKRIKCLNEPNMIPIKAKS